MNDILEPVRREVWKVESEGRKIIKIHITGDLKLQIIAKMGVIAVTTDPKEHRVDELLGYSVETHEEKTDKEWWIESHL